MPVLNTGRHDGWVYVADTQQNTYSAIQLSRVDFWTMNLETGKLTVYSGNNRFDATFEKPHKFADMIGAPSIPDWQYYLWYTPCVVKSIGLTTPRPRIVQWFIIALALLSAVWLVLAVAGTIRSSSV